MLVPSPDVTSLARTLFVAFISDIAAAIGIKFGDFLSRPVYVIHVVLYVIGYSVTVLHPSLADKFCTQNYKIYITG